MHSIIYPSDVPSHFICPISLEIMHDPVTLCTGQTYERTSIQHWFDLGHKNCPSTMQDLQDVSLTPNHALKHLIQEWCLQQSQQMDMSDEKRLIQLLQNVKVAKGETGQVIALQAIRLFLEKKESLKELFVSKGGVEYLLSLLGSSSLQVTSDVVSILVSLPLDITARRNLARPANFSTISYLLRYGNPSTKQNAVRLMNVLIEMREPRLLTVSSFQLLFDVLQPLVEKQQHVSVILAALRLLKSMIRNYRSDALTLVGRLVVQLVDLLSHSDLQAVEMALDILDTVVATVEGREAVRNCPGAITKLVGVMIRLSEICTCFTVSILLVLCLLSREEVSMEAVNAGLPAKLLLVVQSGCSLPLKHRCLALLKLVTQDCKDCSEDVLNAFNFSQTLL